MRENAASDPLAAVLNGSITDWMRGLRSAGLARISLQDEPPEGLGNKGGRAFWNAATGETDKQVRDVVKEAFASAAAHAKDAALRHILRVLAPMAVAAARQRLADGELGFDDLLVLTHQLLSEHPSVRAELRTQITHLFVDEFQDTDPLQFEIISMLCDTEPGARGPVLFAVGDPKQAIYAFRSADVRLFNELAATADQAGYLSKLVANHRTRPDVAKWINATVSRRFLGDGIAHQAAYEDLVPSRPAEVDPGPPVTLIGTDDDGQPRSYGTALPASLAEAADIVDVISEARGNWLVGSSDETRHDRLPIQPARYGDIAVLVRSRTGLGHLENALRTAEIPYRIEGGSLVYECREVYELLRVLRAVDDPSNEAKLVTALRTTVFGLSDLDLFQYKHATATGRPRTWGLPFRDEFDDGGSSGARAVHEAMWSIAELGRIKHVHTPAQLLAKLYDEHLGLAVAQFEGEHLQAETWRRVRFVIDEARAWSDATGGTLHEYLEWVDTRIEQTDRSEVAPDEREDSVRILTIHAAKGLQFPIVVVSGLGRADPGSRGIHLRWIDNRPELALGVIKTLEVKDEEAADLAQAEEARLLYVATTRAQDHLVLALHSGQATKACPARRLAEHLVIEGATIRPAAANAAGAAAPEDLSAFHEPSDGSTWPELVRPDPNRRRVWTPSGIAKHLSDLNGPVAAPATDPLNEAWADRLDDDEGVPARVAIESDQPRDPGNRKDPPQGVERERSSGRYGTSVGIAVHEVLQRVSLDDPLQGFDEIVASSCDAADLRGRARRDVANLARSIIDCDLFGELCRATSRRREMYVGTTIGEGENRITLWGYVDAIFLSENGELVLIDFKTDSTFTSAVELKDRYRDQIGAYALALERSTGRRVARAALAVGQRTGEPAVIVDFDPVSLRRASGLDLALHG